MSLENLPVFNDDDEVRRVCKTPGCTRQYYQRSGLPLPSPWIKYWHFHKF